MTHAYKCNSCKTFFEGNPAFRWDIRDEDLTLCKACYDILSKSEEGEQKLTPKEYENTIHQLNHDLSYSRYIFVRQGSGLQFTIEPEVSRIKKHLEAQK